MLTLEQKGRVCSESQSMVYKFQELFTATRKSLWQKQVLVKDLVHHLECLSQLTRLGTRLTLVGVIIETADYSPLTPVPA